MNCPNCKQPFIEERPPKFLCSACGWLEKIDKEWKSCEAPESPAPQVESPPPQEPDLPAEPDPAAHEPDLPAEPDPAAHEPDPRALEPDPVTEEPTPENVTKSYLGGLLTVTEVNE